MQAPDSTEPVQDDVVLIQRSARDIVIHGLSSNQAWLVLAGLLGVYSQLPESSQLSSETVVTLFPDSMLEATAAQIWLIGFVLLMIGVALMLGLSVLASLLIYKNFQLSRIPDGFAVGHGALSRRELHVRQRRIQTVAISRIGSPDISRDLTSNSSKLPMPSAVVTAIKNYLCPRLLWRKAKCWLKMPSIAPTHRLPRALTVQ